MLGPNELQIYGAEKQKEQQPNWLSKLNAGSPELKNLERGRFSAEKKRAWDAV